METTYIIIFLLSAIIAGLVVALICQNRRISNLQKFASRMHFEKEKLFLLFDRMGKSKEQSQTDRNIAQKSN